MCASIPNPFETSTSISWYYTRLIPVVAGTCLDKYIVDATYKTHEYKVQPHNRLKIVWNGPDVYKYIIKGYKTQHFSFNKIKFI